MLSRHWRTGTVDPPCRGRGTSQRDGDDCGWVGGRHNGAKQQTRHQWDTGKRPQRQTDDGSRDQSCDDREQQNRRRIVQHAPHIGGDPGLEHQQRQKDVNEGGRADRQFDKDIGKRIGLDGPA
jgi:hypothetical protein